MLSAPDGFKPGWRLTLTCAVCEREATFAAVVPTLVVEAAARAGWVPDVDALVKPDTAASGLCGACLEPVAVGSTRH